jgi:hypothetical protein
LLARSRAPAIKSLTERVMAIGSGRAMCRHSVLAAL